MKKLLVVALSVVMVLAFAALAMAATETFTGNVNAEFNTIDNINNGYGDVWAEIDYAKDFTEGWSGGLKFRIKPGANNTTDKEVPYEGDGFIKYTADMYALTFKTGGSFGVGDALNAPDAAAGQVSGANAQVDVTPMEGLTASLYLNETADATTVPTNDAVYNFGLKGVYDLSPLKVGVGYSAQNNGTTATAGDIATMGVFGSYKLLENALTVGLEYQTRTTTGVTDPEVGMKVYADYTKDALTAGFSYITRTNGFYTKNDKATEAWSLPDRFMNNTLAADITNGFASETDTRYLMSISASYAVTDTIKVGANIDMTDAKYSGTKASDNTAFTDVSSGYKVYVSDTIVPDLTLEGGYQSFLDSKVYVKLSAKL